MTEDNKYNQTYTRFAEADIIAKFNGVHVATFDGITWVVTREAAPIYTSSPRSFTRGKRGIAGSFICDQDITIENFQPMVDEYYERTKNYQKWTCKFGPLPGDEKRTPLVGGGIVEEEKDPPKYWMNQLPPFDIHISFVDEEFGYPQTRTIYGIEPLSDGAGATEIKAGERTDFVARDIGPLYRPEAEE